MPRSADMGMRAVRLAGSALSISVALAPGLSAAAGDLPAAESPVGTGDVASVGLSLLIVLGAILLCSWLYSRSRGLRGGTGDVFNIVASQPLGPRERIVVIEIAGRQLVVAMTPSQISTLHVFDEPVVRRPGGTDGPGDSVFAGRFRAILRGKK